MARISTKEAAKVLGIPPYALTMWIKSGTCPFGVILHEKKSPNGHITSYICKERLQAYLNNDNAPK